MPARSAECILVCSAGGALIARLLIARLSRSDRSPDGLGSVHHATECAFNERVVS
jgi:hypothetical protein